MNAAERFQLYNDKRCWRDSDGEQRGVKTFVKLLKNWSQERRPLNPEL